MVEPRPAPVIAIFNASEDIVTLLREVLESEGFRTVAAFVPDIKRGRQDLLQFFEQHAPQVIIYDISPPYEENWTFFRLVQDLESAKGSRFVVTTTNRKALEDQIGPQEVLELIGKPYDLEAIIQSVHRALEAVLEAEGL